MTENETTEEKPKAEKKSLWQSLKEWAGDDDTETETEDKDLWKKRGFMDTEEQQRYKKYEESQQPPSAYADEPKKVDSTVVEAPKKEETSYDRILKQLQGDNKPASKMQLALAAVIPAIVGNIAGQLSGAGATYGGLTGASAGMTGVANTLEQERAQKEKATMLANAARTRPFAAKQYLYTTPGDPTAKPGYFDVNTQSYEDAFGNPLPAGHIPFLPPQIVKGEEGGVYPFYPGSSTMGTVTPGTQAKVPGQSPKPQAPTAAPVRAGAAARPVAGKPGEVGDTASLGLISASPDVYQRAGITQSKIDEMSDLSLQQTPAAEIRLKNMRKQLNDAIEREEGRGYKEKTTEKEATEKLLEPRTKKLSNSIGYYNQFVPALADVKSSLDAGNIDQARIKADALAKLINTMQTASSDAVGAEEIGRLLPETKFKVANYFGAGAAFGTDIPGFVSRMEQALKAMRSYQKKEIFTVEKELKKPFPGKFPVYSSQYELDNIADTGDTFFFRDKLIQKVAPGKFKEVK